MSTEGARGDRDYVVLLHGLGRTRLSMVVPRHKLARAGFEPISIGYPSRRRPVEESARAVLARLKERLGDSDRTVHFLTHSMGGIVLRMLLAEGGLQNPLGSTVMLAPPNRGSSLAERFGDHLWFRTATGPAGQQLRTGRRGVAGQLGSADFTVGVIAGNRATSPWAFLMRGDSDGTVAVDETALDGMNDFLVVPRGHTFIMNDPEVIDQAIHFFRHGRFAHAASSAQAQDEGHSEEGK